MLFRRFYPLMDEAAGAGEGGGAGGGGEGAGASAGAGAGGEGGQGAGGDAASLLAGAAAGGQQTDFIPEKLRVMKDDGSLDLDASSRKMAEAYGALEKRVGGGDIPPKSAEEYTVTNVPEAFKESFDPKTDQGFKDFSGKMHALGLTQKQMDGVMEQYFTLAPQLVAGAAMLDANTAKTQLEQAWEPQGGFDHQIKNAFQGADVIAKKAGIPIDQIMAPNGLGNNVMFLRMMAAIAPEFAEDTSSGGQSMGGASTEEQVNELMMGEAYRNPKHADHEKVSQRVKAFFEKKYGTAAVA